AADPGPAAARPAPEPALRRQPAAPTAAPDPGAAAPAAASDPGAAQAASDPGAAAPTAASDPGAEAPAAASDPGAAQAAAQRAKEGQARWPEILERLRQQDMFSYLFARHAEVAAEAEVLVLYFAKQEKANYNVFTTSRGQQPLIRAVRETLGHPLRLAFRVREQAESQPDGALTEPEPGLAWLNRLTQAAQALGIPVERPEPGADEADKP
ncbi:MAG: hypothetical protein PHR21_07175, partial [Oscillospiraceae bacterium]|nr:hypothetical protein [Oscillospiraceae bacterium]